MTTELDLGAAFDVDHGAHDELQFAATDLDAFESYDDDDLEYDEDDDEVHDLESAELMDDDDDEEILGTVLSTVAPGLVNSGKQALKHLANAALNPLGLPGQVVPKNYAAGVKGTRQGSIMTRNGPVRAQFSRPFVTRGQLRAALRPVRSDIKKVSARSHAGDVRLRKRIAKVGKSSATALATEARARRTAMKRSDRAMRKRLASTEERLESKIQESQMMAMLVSMMGANDVAPHYHAVKDDTTDKWGEPTDADSTVYVDEDASSGNDMLLPLMMMSMSGDSSGGDGIMSNPLMMILLMQSL